MQPDRMEQVQTRATSFDAGLQAHMQRVYNIMALGLAVTGFTAYAVSQSTTMMQAIFGTPLQWVVMLAPLAFIFLGFTPNRARTMSFQALTLMFTGFSALFGLSISYIFMVYSGADITRVFFITAGMFAGTSIYGYTTKKDLSGMGGLMIMGLIGIIIAGLVNIFMQSAMLHFVTSVIGVIVFTGLTAWDTQNIKETYRAGAGDANSKMAVMGALSLYLNFVNLFMMLLHLFGSRD